MSDPSLIGSSGASLREAFGKALVNLADSLDFVVFDCDVAGGTGVHHFRKAFPRRFYQCGIAEQNMMSAAAGFSYQTNLPVFATTFAVFHMRAIEQARLSIGYANRNVKVVASHPGLDVGPDGASAQCLEDLAMWRALPNFAVISPSDPLEMDLATRVVLEHVGPVYMRTGRSSATRFLAHNHTFELGKITQLIAGEQVTIFACGAVAFAALEAARQLNSEGFSVGCALCPSIKPLDHQMLLTLGKTSRRWVSVEDHSVIGGLGSALAEWSCQNMPKPITFIGTQDQYGQSGEGPELHRHYGLDAKSIAQKIKAGFND